MKKHNSSHRKKKKQSSGFPKNILPRHYIVILTFSLLLLFLAANVQTTQVLIAGVQTNVLGEDEEKVEKKEEKKEEKKGSENKQEEQKKQEERQKEAAKSPSATSNTSGLSGKSGSSSTAVKTKTETVSPSGFKVKTESEGTKRESEIETADGQKIKTKIEDDGTTKIEVENGSIKLKYKIENGQVVLKAENETGEEVELEDEELEKLEDAVGSELENEDIKLVPTKDRKLSVTKNQITATTDFPLSIDVTTKQLVVTTPAGQKTVTVLPDKAVENLFATGIINRIETQDAGTVEGQRGALNGVVKLEVRDNKMVYRVNGTKVHQVFGFIPFTTPVTAFVSTDTGETIAKQQSILTNVVDLLSP